MENNIWSSAKSQQIILRSLSEGPFPKATASHLLRGKSREILDNLRV